ncbi:alpha/beta fold hydrolase, partial [Deinococcus sp.]|uniref:alpha/beta hydrolase n=1 Tax=Deinococcus sp. TaxID=47478 RepID=UPI002869CFB6
ATVALAGPQGLPGLSVHTVDSPLLGRVWRYSVYQPQVPVQVPLPLLYLLHGRGGDHTSWAQSSSVLAALDARIRAGTLPPVRAVMPDFGSSWYVDGTEPFEQAFFQDLLPRVEAQVGSPAGRVVAGVSMGGYGALRYALTRPELFGAAILLSPAIYAGLPPAESSARSLPAFGLPFQASRWRSLNYPRALARPGAVPTHFFIAAGDAEYRHPLPAANAEVQAALLHARLAGRGARSHLRIRPGGHDWGVWHPAFLEGLEYALTFGVDP